MIRDRIIGFIIIFGLIICAPAGLYGQDEILIGLIPEANIFKQMDRYRPLADYLSQKLGTKVRLTILSRYGDLIDKFVTRDMDGAFFGTFTGAIAMEKLDVQPVAIPVSLDGKSSVSSYIVTRKNSGITTVEEMKNTRIVFVDRASATGYLFALAYFRDNGVEDLETYFKNYDFTGSHASVVYSVLDNRADVGVTKSRIFENMIEKDPLINDELTVIAKSNEFPDIILCLRKDFPEEIGSQIKGLLLSMDEEKDGKQILQKFEALKFISTDRKDFTPFFDSVKRAGIDIKTYKYR